MVGYGRKSSVSPRRRRDYSNSSSSPRSRVQRGRDKSSRSPRGRKQVKLGKDRRNQSSRSRSRSSRSRSQSRSRNQRKSRNNGRSKSPLGKRSPRQRSRNRGSDRSSPARFGGVKKKSALKKKRAGGNRFNHIDSDFSPRPARGKVKRVERRNSSEISPRPARGKVKRFERRNSSEIDSSRSYGGPERRKVGGRKSALKKKRYPRGIQSTSEEDGDKFKRRQKLKKLPWIEDACDKNLNRKKRPVGKRNTYSSEEEPLKGKLGRPKSRKPWGAAKEKDSGKAPRFGRKASPRFRRKSLIPQKKKARPKFRKWEESEDDSSIGLRSKKLRNKKLTDSSENDDFSIPRKKKASILSDVPAIGFRRKKKKVKPLSQIRKFPKIAPPEKPQPPTPEEAQNEKKKPIAKLEEEKTNLLMVELQQDVKKLREELKDVVKLKEVVKKVPSPSPDTVAISKAKLVGLLEGKVINDAGGVEDAIESLVNKRQELEGQLVEMRDKLQKKNAVEKNLEKMKDELQRNLERIEKNSRAMSPNSNSARSNNTIYRLSQRITALEQEHKEIRHHEMFRYSLPPATPVYWRPPPPVPRPLVQIHQPTAWRSPGHYQARGVHPRQTHYTHAPGVPLDQPNSPHDRSSERSFVDGGDIAELCSALSATVDLVKKVINVGT